MSARGIGAFIQGGFQGYQFGESIKDNKAQRARQTELDRIAEEQRVRQNRREDTRDTWAASDQAYNESERDRVARQRAQLEAIDARTIEHVDEYRARRGVPSTISSVIDPPANAAPVTIGAAADSTVVGDAGADRLGTPDSRNVLPMTRAPGLTPERAAQLQSIGQLLPPPAQRGALPVTNGVGLSEPEAQYLAGRGELLPPAPGVTSMPSDITGQFDRSFRTQGPAGQAVPNNVAPPPSGIVENLPPASQAAATPSMTRAPGLTNERAGQLASINQLTPPPRRGALPVTTALDSVGTPATKALAETIAAAPPTAEPGTPAAREEARTNSRTWVQDYMEIGAPYAAEQMVRAGMIAEAQEYITWAQEGAVQRGMEAYGQAAMAAANNDFEGFGSAIVDLYNNEAYFGDGFTIVQDQSGFLTDENGQVAGARVTLADEQGVETVQYWENIDDLMESIMLMVAPENAFAQRFARQGAAADAQASEAERQIELEDYFAREIFKDSLNDDSRERVAEAQKVLASDLTLQFSQKTPEEQLALVANYLAQQDQLTDQLRGGGPAAGTPAAPPAVLRR